MLDINPERRYPTPTATSISTSVWGSWLAQTLTSPSTLTSTSSRDLGLVLNPEIGVEDRIKIKEDVNVSIDHDE
jgi:hypothetical protein